MALPEDGSARYELQEEGAFVLAPRPRPLHQDAIFRLGMQIHRFLPPEVTMLLDVDVVVEAAEPATVRAPDVVVIPHFWLVDLDPPAPTITAFAVGAPGDGYVESRTASGELVVTEPFEMRIDVDALIDWRPGS